MELSSLSALLQIAALSAEIFVARRVSPGVLNIEACAATCGLSVCHCFEIAGLAPSPDGPRLSAMTVSLAGSSSERDLAEVTGLGSLLLLFPESAVIFHVASRVRSVPVQRLERGCNVMVFFW